MRATSAYRPPTELPFAPGSISWRVSREPIVGLAAGPTLLLQVSHPLVGAAVGEHSDYESDPWGRLWRTLDVTLKLAFGSPEVSERQARVLRRMHDRVRGTSPDGVAYHALDPDLLLWVWATLVYSALDTYERVFGALSEVDRARFYDEQKLLAVATGVPAGHWPDTYDDFLAYVDRVVREDLRPTHEARTVARMSQHPPLPWPLRPLAGNLNAVLNAGLLPATLREELGLRWTPTRRRALAAVLAATHVMCAVLPRRVRQAPTVYLVNREHPVRLMARRAA